MSRVMIVHARDATLPTDGSPVVAHAYGPFSDVAAALAWELQQDDEGDTCQQFLLAVVGPAPADVAASELHEVWHDVPWPVLVASARQRMQPVVIETTDGVFVYAPGAPEDGIPLQQAIEMQRHPYVVVRVEPPGGRL